MNNSLTNFSTDPNSPNYGEKHKAPRSYTSPTIIVGPDFYMGIGSPGGNKIPTILNEVIVDYLRGNGTLQESINKPRFIMMVEQSSMKMLWMITMSIFSKSRFRCRRKRNDPNFGSVQGAVYNKKIEQWKLDKM